MIDPDTLRRSALPLGSTLVALPKADLDALLREVLELRADLLAKDAVIRSLAARVAAQSEVLAGRAEKEEVTP